ncbi:Dolichyl pyrophosphate Man9GlcNAc2 alpha-1,3-glucosyltransferase [Chionoecetes opilio]|uniref:Alpha-1,3-glucosyltransferase n=1 Tax=Chionoecetes opilio TaxID=41210 RepID=A0A8J5D2K3_CHIOP|nr:Dolichyl pyrophosphate Man9GlcNAc2 alpha-1,3-glucosyltransferase [Chionoecetes opilio]
MMTKGSNTALVCVAAVLLRWCVSLHPYSGQGKPPMYGDYEAQRHWQEVTVNLPVAEWYVNTTDNDLQYWGLDYPPLTAYHSYLCGLAARRVNASFVALHESRGYESETHKLFMRYTVLVADLLVYLPAAYCLMSVLAKWRAGRLEFVCLLLYPGLYLVDYGHFQYNNVSLGLFVMAVAALTSGRDCIGAVLFCLALNYKQMELYHALPFFFYLLGTCFRQGGVLGLLWKMTKLGCCVVLTFSAVWLPFASNATVLSQALRRLFPFERGLFEDKVASVWCSLSVFVKLKTLVDNRNMALICLLSTVVCMLPSSLHLVARPTLRHLRYALLNASLVFFLFSYHVHEKTILLAAVPACMLVSEEPFMTTWFLTVSTASLLPLMIQDGLTLPLLALGVLFMALTHHYILPSTEKVAKRTRMWVWMRRTYFLSVAGLAFLTAATLFVQPPDRLPDLFPVLLAIYCCGHFVFFCLYFHYCQFTLKYNNNNNNSAVSNNNNAKKHVQRK